jgi:nucleoside-diphosphate-sugar epimerase
MVLDAWRASRKYDVVGLARSEGEYTDILVDTSDLDALTDAFKGADAVVHLAGSAAVDSSWDDVLQNNIIGLRNVFEAARLAGVKRVVFASSNHAVGTFETANAPHIWEIDDPRQIDHTSEIMPDSYYGVSKAYGEAMARYYVDHHGLQAVCLRIGGATGTESPNAPENLWKPERDEAPGIRTERARWRAVWLSNDDCVHLIERSIDANVAWALVYGISDNPRKLWDIEHAREVLGYNPKDSAPRELLPGEE